MTKAEKVGAIILALWCIGWLLFIFLMPAYGTGILNGR